MGEWLSSSSLAYSNSMEDYIPKWIFSGAILWAITFLLIRSALPKRTFGFCNRIVSTIHASIATSLSVLSAIEMGCPICPLASKSSPLQTKTLAVTVSYMIYDLICSQFDEHQGIDYTMHHVVAIGGLGSGLAYEVCGSEMVAAIWITEISNPFLHAREFLKELNYVDTDLNFVFDILFAVTFSIARMVAGPYLTFLTFMADNPVIIKVTAMGLQLLSAFWFYKIVRMTRHKLSRRRRIASGRSANAKS